MQHINEYSNATSQRMTPALLDGLVTLSGLAIAIGSFFHAEIMIWWAGA